MRAVIHAADRVNHLLLAMAADAASLDVVLDFVDSPARLLSSLHDARETGWLPDVVMVVTDGDEHGLDAVASIDRDPTLWPIPVVVASTAPNDTERLRAYACGADWYQQLPTWFSEVVELVEVLPSKAAMAARLFEGPSIVDAAALELVEEIEAYLLTS